MENIKDYNTLLISNNTKWTISVLKDGTTFFRIIKNERQVYIYIIYIHTNVASYMLEI